MRAVLPALLAAAAASLAAGCGSVGTVAAGGDLGTGKTLFQQKCAGCHALKDANARGAVGPNLDDALGDPEGQGFDESTVRDVVRGQIAYASPPMPRDLVTGKQADAVASYVARVAGKPVQGGGIQATPAAGQTQTGTTTTTAATTGTAPQQTTPAGGAAATEGKAVFEANCAACHTLAAAGASGTVGPNLDQLKPAKDRVASQVEHGGAVMPAFGGRLTKAQIDAVAGYVSSVAG